MFNYETSSWCPVEDSNLHALRRCYLKAVRLPIPPTGHSNEPVTLLLPTSPIRGLHIRPPHIMQDGSFLLTDWHGWFPTRLGHAVHPTPFSVRLSPKDQASYRRLLWQPLNNTNTGPGLIGLTVTLSSVPGLKIRGCGARRMTRVPTKGRGPTGRAVPTRIFGCGRTRCYPLELPGHQGHRMNDFTPPR